MQRLAQALALGLCAELRGAAVVPDFVNARKTQLVLTFCPVALVDEGVLVNSADYPKIEWRYAVYFRGRIFFLSSPAAQRAFARRPVFYAMRARLPQSVAYRWAESRIGTGTGISSHLRDILPEAGCGGFCPVTLYEFYQHEKERHRSGSSCLFYYAFFPYRFVSL